MIHKTIRLTGGFSQAASNKNINDRQQSWLDAQKAARPLYWRWYDSPRQVKHSDPCHLLSTITHS
ncbi:hypothetical protein EKG39_15000 [Shewanella atlantica]|uniref:Uncharacterized protein n=1 Tax=Shewanella atlantica TaxID=271099 RepID=A0A431W572_9GAMM|nr:hypothetical protein EKG39_15000 [Shewanella atlantica]